MKRTLYLTLLMLLVKSTVSAQHNGWTAVPENPQPKQKTETTTKKKTGREVSDKPYLAGAVPEVDGQVSFIREIDAPGKSAKELYEMTYQLIDQMSREEKQIKSRITLKNDEEHSFAARFNEWLVFSEHLLAVDRTEFHYSIVVLCQDGHVTVGINHITYIYSQGPVYKAEDWSNLAVNGGTVYRAEEWITDREAINNKGTKLLRSTRKFRIGTVDRINQIFTLIEQTIQQ